MAEDQCQSEIEQIIADLRRLRDRTESVVRDNESKQQTYELIEQAIGKLKQAKPEPPPTAW